MITPAFILRLIANSSYTGFENALLLAYNVDGREHRLRSKYNVISRWPNEGDKLTITMRSSAGFVIKGILLGRESLPRLAGKDGLGISTFEYDRDNCQIEVSLARHMDHTRASLRDTMEHHLMMLAMSYSE